MRSSGKRITEVYYGGEKGKGSFCNSVFCVFEVVNVKSCLAVGSEKRLPAESQDITCGLSYFDSEKQMFQEICS